MNNAKDSSKGYAKVKVYISYTTPIITHDKMKAITSVGFQINKLITNLRKW